MVTIEQKFTLYAPDENGSLEIGRKMKNGLWTWNHINFENFILGNITIQGLAEKYDEKWNILAPFRITKDKHEISFNPTNSGLERLCEFAINDFSTFRKVLFELTNVEDDIKIRDLKVELITTIAKENTEVMWIREVGRKSENKITFHHKMLEFYNIPIGGDGEWYISGELIQKNREKTWHVKIAHLRLFKEILCSNIDGVIEEVIPLTEKTFRPFKKKFISLYEAVKNEKFELVEEIFEDIEYMPLPKISKRAKRQLAYYTRDWTFRVFVDGNYWSFGFDNYERKGSDKKIASTFRKLIKLTAETGDDAKLRRFCGKLIYHEPWEFKNQLLA